MQLFCGLAETLLHSLFYISTAYFSFICLNVRVSGLSSGGSCEKCKRRSVMWLNLVCQCAVRPPRSWVPICPAAVLCSSQWHNCAPCPTPWVPTFHSELKHAVPQPRYLDSKTLPPAVIWSSIPHCAITIIIMCAIPHPHLCFSSLALSLLLYHQSRVPPSPVLNSVCAYRHPIYVLWDFMDHTV